MVGSICAEQLDRRLIQTAQVLHNLSDCTLVVALYLSVGSTVVGSTGVVISVPAVAAVGAVAPV